MSARDISRGRVALVLLGGTLVTGLAIVVVAASDQIPVLVGAAFVAGIAQSIVLVTYM